MAIAEESSPIAGTLPKKSPGREKTTTTSQINGEVYNEHQEAQSVVILRGDGLQEAVVNRPAEFVIDCSELPVDAVGKLRATLIGDKADIPVRITALRNQASLELLEAFSHISRFEGFQMCLHTHSGRSLSIVRANGRKARSWLTYNSKRSFSNENIENDDLRSMLTVTLARLISLKWILVRLSIALLDPTSKQ